MKIFKKIGKLDEEYSEKEISNYHEAGYAKVKEALGNFFQKGVQDPEMLTRRWADIREMILNLDARIHYWESRRTQFLQLITALLASSIVGIIAIVPQIPQIVKLANIHLLLYIPLCVSCLALFYGCLRLLMIWNEQNNPSYPFTKAYRNWRWQYRHAEKSPIDPEIKYDKESYENQIRKFAENLVDYKLKTLNSDPTELFDQDISQLFLLITNEKFKIKFVNKLRDNLIRTTQISFVLGLLTFIVFLIARFV